MRRQRSAAALALRGFIGNKKEKGAAGLVAGSGGGRGTVPRMYQHADSLIFHHTTTIMQESASEFLQEQTFPTVQPIPKFHQKKQNNPIGTCLILAATLPVTAHSEKAKSPSTLPPCPLAPTLPPPLNPPPGDSLEQRWTKGEQLAFSRMTLLF